MATHEAACSCGQLTLVADGDPIRTTVCHCLACQRRTGSVFSVNARFDADQVTIAGEATTYVRHSDEDGEKREFFFCATCGATVYYRFPQFPGMVAVPVGAFAEPGFPPPARSIYEERRHPWVELPPDLERS